MAINVQYQIPAALMKERRQREKRMYDRQVNLMRLQQAFNAQQTDFDYQRRLKTLADNRDFQKWQMDRAREWKLEDRDYAEKARGIQRQQGLDDLADERKYRERVLGDEREFKRGELEDQRSYAERMMGMQRQQKKEDVEDERAYRNKMLAYDRELKLLDRIYQHGFNPDLMMMELEKIRALTQDTLEPQAEFDVDPNLPLRQQADMFLYQSEQMRNNFEQSMIYTKGDESALRQLDAEWMEVENSYRSGFIDEPTHDQFYLDYAKRRSKIMPKMPKIPEKTQQQAFDESLVYYNGQAYAQNKDGKWYTVSQDRSNVISMEAELKFYGELCNVREYDKNGIQIGERFDVEKFLKLSKIVEMLKNGKRQVDPNTMFQTFDPHTVDDYFGK